MPNRAVAHSPKPGTRPEEPGTPKAGQRHLHAVSAQRTADDQSPERIAADHSSVHDWVQSQLRKLGDIIHVLDHGGVLLDKDQAVLARLALGDAYAYRSEMLAAAPESDMLSRRYLALFKQIAGTEP